MSTYNIYSSVVSVVKNLFPDSENKTITHLDVGTGYGKFIIELSKNMTLQSEACDINVERFLLKDTIKFKKANINTDPLPYPDQSFDLVTATEVVEHLENPRFFIREIARILKPGGYVILSTPNILNTKSRLRFMYNGFYNLFGPLTLPKDSEKVTSTNSHITPISCFYLGHSLYSAGFDSLDITIDKCQKTSVVYLFFLWPFILPLWLRFFYKDSKQTGDKNWRKDVKIKELAKNNASFKVLTGRTIIISAQKI
jgi:ubiquinone/menaquinone biosynthesis C-methylase UbiE